MNSSPSDIDRALVDVRRAYRLLHDYQRAALDAARYIGLQLGLKYGGGWSNFSDCAPGDSKGSFDCWSWDWLNLMFYDFHFTRTVQDKVLNLSIWLISDTGYYLRADPMAEKTDIASFAAPEASATKVGFLLYWEWKGEYNNIKDDQEAFRRFLEHDGELPAGMQADGVRGKCCDFSRLADEASTDTVITELVQLGQANGYPLERRNKAV